MGTEFVVSTRFKTREDLSATFKKMGISADKFSVKSTRSLGKVANKALSLKRIMGGILGAAAIQRGVSMLREGMRGVATEFISFDDAITAASAKFGIYDRGSKAFKQLGSTAREVGATTEFTSAQAAEGLRFLAKAGWEVNSAISALPSFVDLATASEMDFARAADIATDVMGAFRLRTGDVAEDLKQLTRVNDVMAKAVNMSNIDMEDLFETIKFAGPIAKTAGVSLEKFSAMAAFIGGSGIKGSLGGTALRTMFLNLAAPTDKMKGKFKQLGTQIKSTKEIDANRKALKKLGIQLTDEKDNLRDPIAILKDLQTAFKGMGNAQKAAALQIIFGKRAVSGAAVSVDGATGKLQEFEKALMSSGGTSKRMAEFMRKSIGKRLAELKSTAIEVGFKFLDAFEKNIPGGIDAALKAVRAFDVKPLIDGVNKAIDVSKELLEVIRDYKGVFIGAAAGIAALKFGGLAVGMGKILLAAKGLIAIGGFKAVFAGLATAVGPVGALALAIGGVTAAIITYQSQQKELRQSVKLFVTDTFKSVGHAMFGIQAFFSEVFAEFQLTLFNFASKAAGVLSILAGKIGATKLSEGLLNASAFFKGAQGDVLEKQKTDKEGRAKSEKLFNTAATFMAGKLTKGLFGKEEREEAPLKGRAPGVLGPGSKSTEGPAKDINLSRAVLPSVSRFESAEIGEATIISDSPKPEKGKKAALPARPALGSSDAKLLPPPGKNEKVRIPKLKQPAQTAQDINFRGEINIPNAPQGTTVKSSTRGAPKIQMNLLGANQ